MFGSDFSCLDSATNFLNPINYDDCSCNIVSDLETTSEVNYKPVQHSKLHKQRGSGLLGRVFCCFGVNNRRSKGQATEENGTAKSFNEKSLLRPKLPGDEGKKCMVIDLDETLVHSSFRPVNEADFIVPVEIDGEVHQVYVLKRPHVDTFLCRMGELFECVLFTASLSKYADPVADLLDKWNVFSERLFRESCVFHNGNYVKDLGRLGRPIETVVILDNSPASYVFHPSNAIPISSWFDDKEDSQLLDLIPTLEILAAGDVSATEFIKSLDT